MTTTDHPSLSPDKHLQHIIGEFRGNAGVLRLCFCELRMIDTSLVVVMGNSNLMNLQPKRSTTA